MKNFWDWGYVPVAFIAAAVCTGIYIYRLVKP